MAKHHHGHVILLLCHRHALVFSQIDPKLNGDILHGLEDVVVTNLQQKVQLPPTINQSNLDWNGTRLLWLT